MDHIEAKIHGRLATLDLAIGNLTEDAFFAAGAQLTAGTIPHALQRESYDLAIQITLERMRNSAIERGFVIDIDRTNEAASPAGDSHTLN